MSQINIIESNNLYPSLKKTISNQETLSSINNFKSAKGGNDNNNNNNTAVNRERIDANFSEIYILPKDSKQEKKA